MTIIIDGTLGIVTDPMIAAKGDMEIGTAASTKAVRTAPANGSTLIADSSQASGWGSATSVAARKNAIINGDFNVWQRGTSFAAAGNGAYSADRWLYGFSGAMVHTLSRSTDVPTVAEAGRLFNYSLLVDCTTADASIAAGDYTFMDHRVEGYNWLPLAQRIVTLSFWVKGTKTGIYCVGLVNSGANRSCVKEYTINTTATWEKKTLTFPVSPSAGTWDYTTGLGIAVRFAIATGSTYQTTADAYQTGNFFATSNQVNATDSTSNDFRLCGVQLEAGSVATELEQRTFPEELALCQRYHWEWQASAASNLVGFGQAYSATTSQVGLFFPVEMRAIPTFTLSTATDFQTLRANGAGSDAAGAVVVSGSATVQTVCLDITSANLVAGDATRIMSVNGNARLKMSAEL
jgi:hypothetical protein